MAPLRAPTMRSVPEMVFANAPRASRRTFSTPSSIAMLSATASRVRPAVTRRFSTLRNASRTIAIGNLLLGGTLIHGHACTSCGEVLGTASAVGRRPWIPAFAGMTARTPPMSTPPPPGAPLQDTRPFGPDSARLSSGRDTRRSKAAASRASWLAKSSDAPASSHCADRRSRKRPRVPSSSAEVGSSATISSGAPMSARAAATRCCWPMLRSVTARASRSSRSSPSRASSRRASASGVPVRAPARSRRRWEKAARQGDVVDHREVGHQVEHLEHEADVVGAESIAMPRRHSRDVRAEYPHHPFARAGHPADQAEQGAFAAAARTLHEHPALPPRRRSA